MRTNPLIETVPPDGAEPLVAVVDGEVTAGWTVARLRSVWSGELSTVAPADLAELGPESGRPPPTVIASLDPVGRVKELQRKGYGAVVVHLYPGQEALAARVLDAGADDVLTAGMHGPECAARLRAAARRSALRTRNAAWELDPLGRRFSVRGRWLDLTAMEYSLLARLVDRGGSPVSPQEILGDVWHEPDATPELVRHYVWRLRSKIEMDASKPKFIRTVRGAGYAFERRQADSRRNRRRSDRDDE